MASQMLASVKGMCACTTPNEASASTTEASCLVERGCIEVIVTTFSPRRCDRIARAGIERRSRAVAWPYSQKESARLHWRPGALIGDPGHRLCDDVPRV
jgi:hypothetical protein